MSNIQHSDQELMDRVVSYLSNHESKKAQAREVGSGLNAPMKEIYRILNQLRDDGEVVRTKDYWILAPRSGMYLDWNGNLDRLKVLHKLKIPTLLIGPKGTGKSECVEELVRTLGANMYTLNLSLRCRESHILGRLSIENGETVWNKGPLPRSMEAGDILYLDELNTGEPDVLIKLDECLDHRRQLNHENITITAHDDWWCVSSVNPLTTPGTKPLPDQLLSRFTARLWFSYPDLDTELRIVKKHVRVGPESGELRQIVKFFDKCRKTDELPYIPSIRESIAAAKLLVAGESKEDIIEMVALNAIKHWGDEIAYNTMRQHAESLGVMEAVGEGGVIVGGGPKGPKRGSRGRRVKTRLGYGGSSGSSRSSG